MIKNSLMKFIDSCVGNIARKIEDEFRESDHPRDKGGKFTSKGNEGRGGSTQAERRMMGKQKESGATKSSVKPSKALQDDIQDNLRQIAEDAESRDEFIEQAKSYVEDYVADDFAGDDKRAKDNYGMSSEDVAKYVEDFVKNQLEKEADDWGFGEDDDDDSVTGPEDRDYMNEEDDDDEEGRGGERDPKHEASVEETDDIMQRVSDTGIDVEEFMADLGINTSRIPEDRLEETLSEELYADPNLRDKALKELKNYAGEEDDDAGVSLEQYKKNVSENFDGDEEYEVEARYDRAKYHSDKFKKLQNGEYDGTPEEKRLKNYYRRVGMKKPEDAFKVWWDI